MKNLLIGLVSLPLLAGIAAAGELTMLDDAQMDRMTAGQVTVKIQKPTPPSTAVNVQNMEAQAPSFSLSPESTQSDSPPFSISIQQTYSPHSFGAMPTGVSAPLMAAVLPQ
jgi:hypothetical protein